MKKKYLHITLLLCLMALTCSANEQDGFDKIFNGKDFSGWQLVKNPDHKTAANFGHIIKEGQIITQKGTGNLFTEKEYSDYIVRFEFKLESGANNGLALRAPLKGNPAYTNFELQILDNSAKKYAKLKPWQYHGSLYGVKAAKRGFLKPLGEWNSQEVSIIGSKVKVTLNGTVILDVDLNDYSKRSLKRPKGHFCFAGHGPGVALRNIYLKDLAKK